MSDISIKNVWAHGLGGITARRGETEYPYEEILKSFNEEDRPMVEKIKRSKHMSEFLIDLYRLNQILQHHAIYTFQDVKEKGLPLFNQGEKIGDYNTDNSLCFAKKGAIIDSMESTSGDNGYIQWIQNSISVMLADDMRFANLPRSNNNEKKTQDELRIEGSIQQPNIISIGMPFMERLTTCKKEGERTEKINESLEMIGLMRNLLERNDYRNASIVDAEYGYDLENQELMRIVKEQVRKSDSRITWEWVDKTFGKQDYYLMQDIQEAYETMCDNSENHGFMIKQDGPITCLDYPHAIEWSDTTASFIKEYMQANGMNAVMVNAFIGSKPFMVLASMSEEDILEKRRELLLEEENKYRETEERE